MSILEEYPQEPVAFNRSFYIQAYRDFRAEIVRLQIELQAALKLNEAVYDLIISTDSLLSTVDDITLEDEK